MRCGSAVMHIQQPDVAHGFRVSTKCTRHRGYWETMCIADDHSEPSSSSVSLRSMNGSARQAVHGGREEA